MSQDPSSDKRTREEKFLLIFEAAKRSLLVADYYLKLIREQLPELEAKISNLEGEVIAPILVASLGFVDFAHRFGELVDQLPLLNSRDPEPRKLSEILAPVEGARNHLQHLRGDLSTNEKIDYPLLGTLSWSHGDLAFSVHLSQFSPTTSSSMAYDVVNRRWVSSLQLNLKNTILDFDIIASQMHKTYEWTVQKSGLSQIPAGELKWGATGAFSIEFRVT